MQKRPSSVRAKILWTESRKPTKPLVDKMGLGIDDRILEAVAALRALGFETTASCEGHLRWGIPAPWIDVGVVPLADLPMNTDRLNRKNLIAQKRAIQLLDQFHNGRRVHDDVRIIVIPVGLFGGFRFTNQGSRLQALMSEEARQSKLRSFQREFRAFARFIKSQIS